MTATFRYTLVATGLVLAGLNFTFDHVFVGACCVVASFLVPREG
jgi:hypothetical protein